MSFSSVSGGPIVTDNLILSGGSSSGSATITSDASGDIILTPASSASTNINGLVISGESSGIYSICPSASSNITIGSTSGYLQSLNLYSTGNMDLQSPIIGLYGGISLNSLQVNTSTSPTISTASTSDSITLSASTLNFTPSAGYLRMSQTPYFSSVGTSVQSFTLPCGGVFLMTMVANATSGDQASTPSLSDLWYVFSTGSSNVITPYSTSNEPVSGYFVCVNANGVIGVQSSSTSNNIVVSVYQNDGYFYNFYLTMIS